MKILLVSQMYPGATSPDLGVFVQGLEQALASRGHEIARVVIDHRAEHPTPLVSRGLRAASMAGLIGGSFTSVRSFKPDVVYAHFLAPAGLIAALASARPLVVTAHGRDVRNIGTIRNPHATMRVLARRASAFIVVSNYLRRELELRAPQTIGRTHVIDCGVDLTRFRVSDSGDGDGSTAYLCIGSLSERKNVLRLADAFAGLDDGATLTFVGDGPLRARLESRARIRVIGAIPHVDVPGYVAQSHVVCQPSLIEPFGQGILEAMASGRSVVGTRIGGQPEFVPPEAGILVDPLDADELRRALAATGGWPRPNLDARRAAELHDVSVQAEKVERVLESALH